MIRIREIDHRVLRVVDLEAMIRFYVEVLGCSVERRVDELGLVQLRAGHSLVDLVPVDGPLGRAGGAPSGAGAATSTTSAFASSPSTRRRYGAEGQGSSLYITDPEGNTVLKGPPGPA